MESLENRKGLGPEQGIMMRGQLITIDVNSIQNKKHILLENSPM